MAKIVKHTYFWCQRQNHHVMCKEHPLHQYWAPFGCPDWVERTFGVKVSKGKFFVTHMGDGGNYILTATQILELIAEVDYQVTAKEVGVYYYGDCRDAFGVLIIQKEQDNE